MVNVHMMPAEEGDFIWISYGEDNYSHILIDGGLESSRDDYSTIIKDIYNKGEYVEALILTHIDNDHLQGALSGIAEVPSEVLKKTVKKIYFNTCRGIIREQRKKDLKEVYAEDSIQVEIKEQGYGVGEAVSFLELLDSKGLTDVLDDYVISGREISLLGGATLKIVSPSEKQLTDLLEKWEAYEKASTDTGYGVNKENIYVGINELMKQKLGRDSSVNNASSIAFIFEYEDIKIAFLADALPSTCLKGIKNIIGSSELHVDALKLSHHGSRSNISDRLIKMLPTDCYLLSTNGRGGEVPNKVMLAHVLNSDILKRDRPIQLLCNYRWWDHVYKGEYFTDKDKEEYLESHKLIIKELDEDGINIKDGLRIYGEC